MNIIFLDTGAAWLSSARAVKCLVNSANGRNPQLLLYIIFLNTTHSLFIESNEGLVMSSHYGLNGWATHVYNERFDNRCNGVNGANLENVLSLNVY